MNIRTDYLNNIQQQEESKKASKTTQNNGMFEALLSEQLNNASLNQNNPMLSIENKATNIDPNLMMALNSSEAPKDSDTSLELLTEQTANLLENWESYGKALKQGSSSRDAWDMLAGMEQQIKSMEQGFGQAASPEIKSILDELKILTSVEKVKVNRGDYL